MYFQHVHIKLRLTFTSRGTSSSFYMDYDCNFSFVKGLHWRDDGLKKFGQDHVVCRILVPQPEIELMPPEMGVLTTGPPGMSHGMMAFQMSWAVYSSPKIPTYLFCHQLKCNHMAGGTDPKIQSPKWTPWFVESGHQNTKPFLLQIYISLLH